MRRFGTACAVLLGVLLATAWSLDAGAGPVKKKGGGRRGSAPAAQAPGGGGHESGPAQPSFRSPEPRRPSPSRAAASGGQAPSRDRGRAQPSFEGRPSRPADPPARIGRPDIRRQAPVLGRSPQGDPRRTLPGRSTLPRVGRVPSTFQRGGSTFRQDSVFHGDQTFVRRTRVQSAESHHGGPPGGQHHGGSAHHRDDSGRYYHHHHIGHHDYWVYVHYWTYEPWFWGFYFAPFPAPWYYTWFWIGAPWYVSWGWYYQPYPYYAGPSYWVTDYTISRMLEDEYARGYEAGQDSMAGTPISDPVKEQLRVQVDATAQAFQTESSITLEAALADPNYLFIVDAQITATTVAEGTTCVMTGGDIIRAAGEPDTEIPVAAMTVVTAKQGNCPAGATVNVSYTDLQEMLNTFSETVDDGLNELKNQPTPR